MIEYLHLAATIMMGLYAGALLTEAIILVPYWRTMDEQEFYDLHHTLGPKLFVYYAPLTTLAVVLAVIAAFFGNMWHMIAGGLGIAALLIFFVYFKNANASFAAQQPPKDGLAAELGRWSAWHWTRTLIILAAFAMSVYGTAWYI